MIFLLPKVLLPEDQNHNHIPEGSFTFSRKSVE
jgi:hypothetical protein